MCGIAGYWGEGNEQTLNRMVDSISYRGPDDKGFYINKNVGIAQRRLSIIDLSQAGHQPMSNEDKTVWIVFNGEIYNFLELKESLSNKHKFKSLTDTEVIIHLYEEIGLEVFEKIQGMFAIVIYDLNKNRLILARDRMGKKPLYWGIHNKIFLFGSELKALVAHSQFKKEIDLESLNKYFLFEYIPTPHSIFINTYKLEAGTYIIWDGENVEKEVFWRPKFLPKKCSFDDTIDDLDKVIQKAVSDRLVSDVPLGIFLSGGLDSSLISYYASEASKTKIKTFSIGFKEKSFDESIYASEVARYLNTEHYEKIVSVQECLDVLPKIVDLLDEPMADASIVPTYILSKFAREKVTVALGGDGGDELFCGYDTFIAHRLAFIYEKIPSFIRVFIEKLIKFLPTSFSNMSFDFKIKKFIGGFYGEERYRNQRWLGSFDKQERNKLFKKEIVEVLQKENEFEEIDNYLNQCDSKDFYDRLGLEYQRLYMMDQVLVKVDRASMYTSLEVRAPLLDTRVVDLANHMPVSFKFRNFQKKYILKKLMKNKLPENIIYRKKKGFGMPTGEWIRGDMKEEILKTLRKESLDKIGLFNSSYVQEVLDNHMNGKQDNRKQIWTLFIFVMWWNKWLK